MTEWISHSAEETIEIGRNIAQKLQPPVLVLLSGDLGAGKTTLSKGIISGLGAAREEDVTSPTFTLVHVFQNQRAAISAGQEKTTVSSELETSGTHKNVAVSEKDMANRAEKSAGTSRNPTKVYHVDLYRIEHDADLESLGLEDVLSENAVLLIEWPDRFSLRTDWPKIEIALEHLDPHSRRIHMSIETNRESS